MASAAKPLRAIPSKARNTNSKCQSVASAVASPSRQASTSAVAMTGLRPQLSLSAPDTSKPPASPKVVSDNARLLLAEDTAKNSANCGNSGCTQYSRAKVAKPPQNSASVAFVYSRLPRTIKSDVVICPLTPAICPVQADP